MRKTKRILSLLISLIMVFSMFTTLPMNVSAAKTEVVNVSATTGTTAEGLEYEITNGEVTITGYTGSATDLAIPSTIGGYPVTHMGDDAFECNSSLESITIPDGVTSIGNGAFDYCTSLVSITIPESVTSIGYSAFSACKSLTSIVIPEGVTSIGNGAFDYCTSLVRIIIPESVTSIGYYAFSRCSSLKSIVIPEGVTSIGYNAFSHCASLNSITIPDSVTSIGGSAFYNCTALKSITLPESITNIDGGTFSSCSSLESIIIPEGVTSIGERAFNFCSSLESITIPESLTNIDEYAFYYCNNLTDVYYEGTEEQWNEITIGTNNHLLTYATIHFAEAIHDGLEYEIVDGEATITDYTGSATELILPEELGGYPITAIGNEAFYYCTSLKRVAIPYGVTSIGCKAFANCMGLESVEISDSVTNIGSDAFADCYYLNNLVLPENITEIPDNAFANCYSLTDVLVPEGVEIIGNKAFYYCDALETITLPASLVSVAEYAFDNCLSLTDVYFTGTQEEWDQILFEGYNTYLLNADISYDDQSETEPAEHILIYFADALCWDNITLYYECIDDDFIGQREMEWDSINANEENVYVQSIPNNADIIYFVGDNGESTIYIESFVDGICFYCTDEIARNVYSVDVYDNEVDSSEPVPEIEYVTDSFFESEHDYASDTDKTWIIEEDGALSVNITFCEDTFVEEDWDFITIYDGYDELVGKYTGNTLASQTITVNGSVAKVQLTSDGSNEYYGFSAEYEVLYEDDTDPDEPSDPTEPTVPETDDIGYYVVFVDYDDRLISAQSVKSGEAAVAPEAPARKGYNFVGWDTEFDCVTENLTVKAVYEKIPTTPVPAPTTGALKVEVVGGTGFTISVDGGNVRPQGPSYMNSKMPIGAQVTVVAKSAAGAEFIGWQNSVTGAVLSTDAQYTFVASGNDSIKAVFATVVEGVQMVTFKNDKSGTYGRVLDSQYYGAEDTIQFPDAPTQVGFDFAGWSMTEEEIKSAIANGQDVTVVANWTRAIVPVKVTVNGGEGSGTYNANSAVTAVANEAPAGQKFAYWTDSKGNIKSYSAEYKFFPSVDTEVTAVFVAEDAVIDYQILVDVDSIDTVTVEGKNVFYFSWYCPEEFTFVKSGILAVNKDNYNESTFVAGTSDGNVYDRSPSGTDKAVNSTSWTKSSVTSGQTWRAMAYVQYRDAQGNIITVYSDTVEATKD